MNAARLVKIYDDFLWQSLQPLKWVDKSEAN